jgi:uncharacterized protein
MGVVSDTSPLLNLAIIERLNWVKSLFGVIEVSVTVAVELRMSDDLPASFLRSAVSEGWLRVLPDAPAYQVFAGLDLHIGERTAIELALARRAEFVLLDDADARAAALHVRLRPLGVLANLLRGKREALIPEILPELTNLRTVARFYISKALENQVLGIAGEAPSL